MSYLLEYALALAAFGALLWLPGYALERALWRRQALGGLRGLARVALGLVFWTACAFGLATAGALARGPAAALAGVAALAALAARARWPEAADPAHGARDTALFAAVSTLVCLPLFALAAGPSVSWDANTYHLTLPRIYLAAGGFRPIAMSVYSNWPLGTELLFALAMLAKDYVLAKLLHFGFGLLCVYAGYVGCRALHRPLSGWLALPLFLTSEIVILEFTIAYVDLAQAFFVTAGFVFMLRAVGRTADASGCLLLSGLCCGLASGVKVTGLASAAVIGVLYAPALDEARRRGALRKRLLDFGLRFALPVLVLWLPWAAKAAWYTGNPVYPLFYEALGGVDWSPELAERFRSWQRSIGMGREALDYALLPVRIFLEGGPGYARFDGRLHPVWVALVPFALLVGWRLRLVRSGLAAAALWLAIWSLGSQQMRFLIPMLPLLSMACASAVVEAIDRYVAPRWRRGVAVAAVAAAALLAVSAQTEAIRLAAASLGRDAEDRSALRAAAAHPVYRYVDRELREDAKLLLLGTNHGFFLEREYLADSFFEASQIADWLSGAADADAARALLETRGVTHLLVERPGFPVAWPEGLRALLEDRERTRLRYRAQDGRFRVLELVPEQPER